MKLTLQAAKKADYFAFVDLYAELVHLHAEKVPWKFKVPKIPAFSEAYFEKCRRSKNCLLLLAKNGNELLGLLNMKIEKSPQLPLYVKRRFAKINDLVVKPEVRRLGVGKGLLMEAEKWARSKGVRTIELDAYNKEAIPFYEDMNFEIVRLNMKKDLA